MYDSCNLMDCSPPGYSSTAFSRQDYCSGLPFPSSWPRARTWVSWIADRFFTDWAAKFKSHITCRNKIVNRVSQLPSQCSFWHMKGGEGSSLGTLPMNAILLFRESGLLENLHMFCLNSGTFPVTTDFLAGDHKEPATTIFCFSCYRIPYLTLPGRHPVTGLNCDKSQAFRNHWRLEMSVQKGSSIFLYLRTLLSLSTAILSEAAFRCQLYQANMPTQLLGHIWVFLTQWTVVY